MSDLQVVGRELTYAMLLEGTKALEDHVNLPSSFDAKICMQEIWDGFLSVAPGYGEVKPGVHMNKPIWVWCYITSELRNGRDGMPPLSAWPQAHTYAFLSEAEALAHPESMKWGKAHGYTLQRIYLQEPTS